MTKIHMKRNKAEWGGFEIQYITKVVDIDGTEVDADGKWWTSGLGYIWGRAWWNTEIEWLQKLQRGWGCGTIRQ